MNNRNDYEKLIILSIKTLITSLLKDELYINPNF